MTTSESKGRFFLLNESIRRRRIRDVKHVKVVPQTCWEQIGQDLIDRAQFRKRLSLVVATGGGHTLSTALTNVLTATRTLSYLRVSL